MILLRIVPFILGAATVLPAQSHGAAGISAQIPPHATIPITFTKTVSASHAEPGDIIQAKTTQAVHLTDGRNVPAGSLVTGHVLAARTLAYDKTSSAKQIPGALQIQIDSLRTQDLTIPLHVSLRAMADPLTNWEAQEPKSTDLDTLGTTTQVGGDLLTPSRKEIINRKGDVVGYNRKGGEIAHLIANSRGSLNCDGGDTEQPVSRFSASACGLYGFTGVTLTDFDSSHIGLASTHSNPQIWKNTTALLETTLDEGSSK
jgi:hypothetical protein